jgi:FAD:protein FMN transferase
MSPTDAPTRAVPPVAAEWQAIGVTVRLVVARPETLADARALLESELAALDLACSRFRPDSELVLLDGARGPVPVSPLLADALEVALDAARETGGAVDPTLGQVLHDLGYDRTFSDLRPSGEGVRIRMVDPQAWRQVRLDRSGAAPAFVQVPAGVRLDLGATAKALGADRAAARIGAELATGVLVSLGGDVALGGPAPDGGWPVRIQDSPGRLDAEPTGPTQTIALNAGGLATSGVTARRWTRGGQELHHIIDPHTGLPAHSPWRTVTVAGPSCVRANTASTATVVLGDRGLDWLEATGLAARLVGVDGNVVRVGGWPA